MMPPSNAANIACGAEEVIAKHLKISDNFFAYGKAKNQSDLAHAREPKLQSERGI